MRRFLIALSWVLFSPLTALPSMAAPTTIHGLVVHVSDGDTVIIRTGDLDYNVRLADIDAPEVCHRSRDPFCQKPGQPGGRQAQQLLARMTLGKQVQAQCHDTSYDRVVCYLIVDGASVNAAMAASGLVWWVDRFGRDQRIFQAVQAAQQAHLGLWSSSANVAPYRWRKACWGSGQCAGLEN